MLWGQEVQDSLCPVKQTDYRCSGTCALAAGTAILDYGFATGRCTQGFCEVRGWCEQPGSGTNTSFEGVGAFSVFVRLNYEFPAIGITRDSAEGGRQRGLNLWNVSQVRCTQATPPLSPALCCRCWGATARQQCRRPHRTRA